MVLLVIAALGPAKWAPRTELGWQFDHFIGYFVITLFFCFAWPRPFMVGGVFMAVAALLEGLRALTPDRSAYLPAVFYGAGGALAAALIAELFIRAWRWHIDNAESDKWMSHAAFPRPPLLVSSCPHAAAAASQAAHFELPSTAQRAAVPVIKTKALVGAASIQNALDR